VAITVDDSTTVNNKVVLDSWTDEEGKFRVVLV